MREGREVMWILSDAVFNRDLMQPTIASLIFSIASLRVSPSVMHPGRSVHSTTYRPSSSCSIKIENFIICSYIYRMQGSSIKVCEKESGDFWLAFPGFVTIFLIERSLMPRNVRFQRESRSSTARFYQSSCQNQKIHRSIYGFRFRRSSSRF